MIPQTVAALVAFLVLVAPGIVFELRQERRRPVVQETTFREASRIALVSLLASLGAVFVLVAVGQWFPALLPDPVRWLREGSGYIAEEMGVVARFLLLELGVALLLAFLAPFVFGGRRKATIQPVSNWYQAFREQLPRGMRPFVRVRTSDGTQYCGMVKAYSPEYPLANREIMLEPPLTLERPDDQEPTEMHATWQRVIIPGPAIQDLWVSYQPVVSDRDKAGRAVPAVESDPATEPKAEASPDPGPVAEPDGGERSESV